MTTREKAIETAKARKAKDPKFYEKVGHKGGKSKGSPGGFASPKIGKDGLSGPERARKYASIGGKMSRRGKAK